LICKETGALLILTVIAPAAVMVMVAMAVAELLSAAVAVTVTVVPVGMAAGAVYVVAVPLAVVAELNVPQTPVPVLPQVTVQFTPAVSLVVAENIAVALIASEVGTPERLTVMAVIVMFAEADLVGSVTEVAVTVALLPLGTAEGAV
jgi:hypothetical protein